MAGRQSCFAHDVIACPACRIERRDTPTPDDISTIARRLCSCVVCQDVRGSGTFSDRLLCRADAIAAALTTERTAREQAERKFKDALRDFEENWQPAFVRLRQAVRDGLARGALIPSNPGWSDDDVLHSLDQWREQSITLRARIAELEGAKAALVNGWENREQELAARIAELERERDEARAKLVVYEVVPNAVYDAGKSFMRGQLEPQLTTLRADHARLTELLTTAGVCELSTRNVNVASYVKEWEGRSLKAETDLRAAQAECAVKDGALRQASTALGLYVNADKLAQHARLVVETALRPRAGQRLLDELAQKDDLLRRARAQLSRLCYDDANAGKLYAEIGEALRTKETPHGEE